MAGNLDSSFQDDSISGINVTPLVDVVLVLLIIFLITAPVLYQSAIKVQLPSAKSGEGAKKSPIEFTITKEGELLWNSEKLAWDQIPKKLKTLSGNITEESAVINADQAATHGTVVRLMDILRQSGVTRFAMNVLNTAGSK